MIYAVSTCGACPFYIADGGNHCSGCFPERKEIDVDPKSSRPEWCPVRGSALRVTESEAASNGFSAIVVEDCNACPFFFENEKRRCNIANPKGRPILTDEKRPMWCSLRKELAVVRGN